MTTNPIRLYSDTGYWKVKYYDSNGKRRTKSLGSVKRISKRTANVLAQRFASEIHLNPAKANMSTALPLRAFLERYLQSRTDLKKGTLELHKQTASLLRKFLGDSIRIDKVSRAAAADWRTALAKGQLTKGQRPAEATVCLHTRNAKTIFNHAVRDDLVLFNAFDRLKGNAPETDKDWKYVSRKETWQLLAACRSNSWRLLLALCRFAGLRQGEALGASWSALDWEHKRLEVIAEKTGRKRIIPIDPELYDLLLDSFAQATEGEKLIIPRITRSNLWRDFGVICKGAGLERWEDWCQVLRRNRETDWAQEFPQYVVSVWMGHDITVSAKHYLQVPEEIYEKASQRHEKRRSEAENECRSQHAQA